MEHDIRYTTLDDMIYLRDWLSRPGMLHWFPMSEGEELENAVQCWMGFCRYSCSLTVTVKEQPCGIGTLFLMPYRKVAHHCLFKMIVDPEYQRKGLGSSLLKNLKHLAKNYFRIELMHIEVFDNNPLISILKQQDFREIAVQERFVKENGRYFKRHIFEADL